jgi:hypothetical protein
LLSRGATRPDRCAVTRGLGARFECHSTLLGRALELNLNSRQVVTLVFVIYYVLRYRSAIRQQKFKSLPLMYSFILSPIHLLVDRLVNHKLIYFVCIVFFRLVAPILYLDHSVVAAFAL